MIIIVLGLKTTIEIDYTPPDQYPDYAPPNYRAASSVTLRCSTEGASGSVSYRWSSNCSSCFASNSYSYSITEGFLRSRDNGVHTCTATDSIGNTGSANTQMNIVGKLCCSLTCILLLAKHKSMHILLHILRVSLYTEDTFLKLSVIATVSLNICSYAMRWALLAGP